VGDDLSRICKGDLVTLGGRLAGLEIRDGDRIRGGGQIPRVDPGSSPG
jgi:hypothetical protein